VLDFDPVMVDIRQRPSFCLLTLAFTQDTKVIRIASLA
jgi:hypothetical protein